jgi:hypothetical protein
MLSECVPFGEHESNVLMVMLSERSESKHPYFSRVVPVFGGTSTPIQPRSGGTP